MNKTALKDFAIYSRKKLIEDIILKASMVGVTSKGIEKPLEESDDLMTFDIGLSEPYKIEKEQIEQRRKLIKEIKRRSEISDYNTAFQGLIEEVAYTWFNRIIALRFMEVNDYMPDHIRVLSSGKENDRVPEIVTEVFNSELEFSEAENELIINLKESGTTKDLDGLFNFLFIKTCNSINEYLPELFEKSNDYTELLYNVSFVDTEGVVYKLLNDVDEADFDIESENGNGQVEIIGWLYQYYNTEPKAKVFGRSKSKKITKEDVPAATQLFTPDWIVRYMVENSLGRLWYEGHNDDELKSNWKYYLDEAKQEESVEEELVKIRNEYKNIKPEDIKLIDPCMGSGHILVYAFDVLIDIYKSQGFTEREAARSILENNIFGLDIDKRAYQLSYFALMMKARSYDRRILKRGIKPSVLSINETNLFNRNLLKCFGNNLTENDREKAIEQFNYIIDLFIDAKEYGSLLQVDKCDWDLLKEFANDNVIKGQISFETVNIDEYAKKLKCLIKQARLLSEKYDVVVTNPPYMGSSGMSAKLSSYAKKQYKDSKSDLFAMFIERCQGMTLKNRYTSMITMHSWMFLSSFEKLRTKILKNDIVNMAHLGARAFEEIGGEVVQTTVFVMRKNDTNKYIAIYSRLVNYNSQVEKEKAFLSKNELYKMTKNNFEKIPGSPIAYWVSEKMLAIFEQSEKLESIAQPKGGLSSTDNNKFLRIWHEVKLNNINFKCLNANETFCGIYKWFPFNKGGDFRKWYGNRWFVVNWKNNGEDIKIATQGASGGRIVNSEYYFKESISCSAITSKENSFRLYPKGAIFDINFRSLFFPQDEKYCYLGLLNSCVIKYVGLVISATIALNGNDINRFPVLEFKTYKSQIDKLISQNIRISKTDWDSFETSWDFKKNPLTKETSLKLAYSTWKNEVEERFLNLKSNEEELNRIFIDIYGLQDELTADVADKDITVARIYDTKADIPESIKGNKYVLTKQDVIKQFISYAVGCMFGRYSLDVEGLVFAGYEKECSYFNKSDKNEKCEYRWNCNEAKWDYNLDNSKYKTFIPDSDNCIPITDDKYFEDDIVTLFVEFVKAVYGSETLEENLDFIADALGDKGDSRERIRNYFLKDFFKNHCKMYKKRPIYWLYDSGKQNGFKALVYLHRYNYQTTGIVRANYLHELQKYYRATIDNLNNELNSNTSAHSRKVAEDRIKKIQKQLDECKTFDENMGHLANERIEIDLDDGVKENYQKVQTDRDGKVLQVLAKIK